MLETNLIILAVLLILSGFFSSVETALISLSRVRVKRLLKKGSRSAELLNEFKQNPHKILITILVGNNVVNVAAAAITTSIALNIFQSYGVSIAVGIMTFLILVFGEITPKSIAVQNSEVIALFSIRIIHFLSILLTPLIWVLQGITRLITRVIGAREEPMTEEDVRMMVTMGAEQGAIEEEEKKMIYKIFKFNDLQVSEVMTPRSEMKGLEASQTIAEVKDFLAETPFSRIPVYEKNTEQIIGIFYVKDAWTYLAEGKTDTRLRDIMREVMFVPRTKKIDKLLSEFQKKHIHIAVVVDEHGTVLGVVTLEDLLEEIVGEIVDETDIVPEINKINENTIEVNGNIPLKEVNSILKTKFSSIDFDTVSGFIIEKLDRLPKESESVMVGNHKFTAVKVKTPKILRVKIEKKLPQTKTK
ncbi:MAG: hemolysin family protein [archaeon]|nr:hemolysin family protein [Candidatus Micrarchaeota archaeon]